MTDDLQEKFWDYVVQTNYCWLWNGTMNKFGYGYLYFDGHKHYAHRFSAQLHGWKIPIDKEVDHLCRQRTCVNPGHFRYISHSDNMKLISNKDHEINTSGIDFSTLSKEERLIYSLSSRLTAFGGYSAMIKMFQINRFYKKSLIIKPTTKHELIKFEDIIIDPFKRKYFWHLHDVIKEYNSSLLETEILLDKPLTNNLKKCMKLDGVLT